MLEIIAWLGCAILVLKGVEIYLSSFRDDSSPFRQNASFVVLIISIIFAGGFAFMIVREAAKTAPLEAAYENSQKAVVKSFEEVSRSLEEASAPADKGSAATDEVIDAVRQGGAGMDEASGE